MPTPQDSPRRGTVTTIALAYDTLKSGPFSVLPIRVPKQPKVALVLSGGGARGAAQVGVLKAFERHHVPVDFIAATSMGAIIGGLYASGYSAAEIETIALHTDWDNILSLNDETSRKELFIDQKLVRDRTFLAVRFEGIQPVIPTAVASGQRLTDWLNSETLQALYHAEPDFDHLKIPFRAISVDLISGNRFVMGSGSLAEAIRASATTPLLFSPIERDSMRLIDGGILANVPVDVARERGVDFVVAVNTTSGLRTMDEMKAPWQTVDQLMSISMQVLNSQQLKTADVVITPNIGRHLTFDLHGIDTLIAHGEQSAEEQMPAILRLIKEKTEAMDSDSTRFPGPATLEIGGTCPDSLLETLRQCCDSTSVSACIVRRALRALYATGRYRDVHAEVSSDSQVTVVRFILDPVPILRSVDVRGARLVSRVVLDSLCAGWLDRPIGVSDASNLLEGLLRLYRSAGYSLARITSTAFDAVGGRLTIAIDEGVIDAITVEGGVRTVDAFVLKEFQLKPGDVFEINRANRGVAAIISTTLFEYVYLEVAHEKEKTALTIRLRERPSQLARLGLRADNERHMQGSIDFRDENFQGSGLELGFALSGGDRNMDATIDYKMQRLFGTYVTLSAATFYRTYDTYLFTDAVTAQANRWERLQTGEYQDVRYGATVALTSQFERLGNATVEATVQNVRIRSLQNAEDIESRHQLVTIKAESVVDTKDAYPFPKKGEGLALSYESSIEGLGSDLNYSAMRVMYEVYATWVGSHTIHPRFTMDFADRTMPLCQQFRFGGRDSFFGLREDDSRGRQLILVNLEYRYLLPVRLLFDTYARVRYDIGSVSEVPEEIKFSALRHGLGVELAWETPVGPAAVGAGKSFYMGKTMPDGPLQVGPIVWYFMIGYDL